MTSAVREKLSRRLGDLSPQQRRAAQFVLENPEEVATRSLRQVARAANLAPPTFSRLARTVGCETYDELREMCRSDYRARSLRFADRALELIKSGDDADADPLLVRHAAASVSAVQKLLERIDMAEFERVAKKLADARRVALIGALSAAALVEYAGYVSAIALPNWIVLGRNGASLSAQIMDLGPSDGALTISIDPYARRSVLAARLVSEQGVYQAAITDNAMSPLVEIAKASFFVETRSPQFFPSHIAMLVLLETLIGLVVRRKGVKSQRRIAEVERHGTVLGEYWRT